MCGKFTAMASWAQVVVYSEAFTLNPEGAGGNDQAVTLRVMNTLPVIVWDAQEAKRKVVAMRWGYPSRKNWKVPQPIHARSETIDQLPAFREAFANGQRGIVLMRNFNEGKMLTSKTCEQWTIDPAPAEMVAAAVLWDTFDVGAAVPLSACVLVTVPANELIRRLSTEHSESDRMPAFLEADDWETWLTGHSEAAKACLKTMEGVTWTMAPEPKPPKPGA